MTEKAQQKLLVKWSELEKVQLKSALSACVESPEGRTLLWWLFTITHTDATPFTGEWGSTAFQCGEFNVGQKIKAELIDADPSGYVHLLQEKAHERDSRARDLNATGNSDDYTYHGPEDRDDED